MREDGVTFTEAFSQANVTIPSLNSIFNSQYLADHQIYSNFTTRPFPETLLPKILERNGWKTAAFCGIDFVTSCFGGHFGTNNNTRSSTMVSRYRGSKNKALKRIIKVVFNLLNKYIFRRSEIFTRFSAERLVGETINYFDNRNRADKSFAWVHFFDAHMIYNAPQEYADKYLPDIDLKNDKGSFVSRLENKGLLGSKFLPIIWGDYDNYPLEYFPGLYFAAISYIDHYIGKLIEYLKKQQLYDQSMIIVTSDHGENLMDHGDYCNHRMLFDTTTKVPLIIKYPDNQYGGQINSGLIEHVDIYPSVLEYFGCDYEKDVIRGAVIRPNDGPKYQVNKRYVLSEHLRNYMKSIRNNEWQYIEVQPREEWKKMRRSLKNEIGEILTKQGNILLNRKNGAGINCYSEHPDIVQALSLEMKRLMNECRNRTQGNVKNINADITQQLRSLGYID